MPIEILVVDDDKATRQWLCSVLDAEGYACHVARNTQEAEDLLHRTEVQLALVDIYLGEVNGVEFLKRIKTIVTARQPLASYAVQPPATSLSSLLTVTLLQSPSFPDGSRSPHSHAEWRASALITFTVPHSSPLMRRVTCYADSKSHSEQPSWKD